jgi:excisionase family DNA binding protein
MRLPADTSVVSILSAGPAEPDLDFDTNGVAVNGIGHVWPGPAIEAQPASTVAEVRGAVATGVLRGDEVAPQRRRSGARRHGEALRSPFLDIEDLAHWLGVEEGFVRRLIAQRRIPFVKVGKYVRFDPEEIAVWVDGQRVEVERPSARRSSLRD